MAASITTSRLVRRADALSTRLLADDPRRLDHVRGAAFIAQMAVGALGAPDPEVVVAATWLHDIGYATAIARTGFHPLDGGLFLAREGWPEEVVLLVAHHSHAAMLAPYYGVQDHMAVLDQVPARAIDIVTYCDLRAGVDGQGAEPRARVEDMRRRHTEGTQVPEDVREARYRLLLTTASRIGASLNRAASAARADGQHAARAS